MIKFWRHKKREETPPPPQVIAIEKIVYIPHEETILIPKDIRDAITAVSGNDAIQSLQNLTIDTFPFTSAAHRKKEEQRQAKIGLWNNLTPGQTVEGEGIYIGAWIPTDRDNKTLKKVFHVFAAPEDLKQGGIKNKFFTFQEVFHSLRNLKSWHGHSGSKLETDQDIYSALEEGRYHGEWLIPPREILDGRNHNNTPVHLQNLAACKDQPAFIDTLAMTPPHTAPACSELYWSSTLHPTAANYAYATSVSGDGGEFYDHGYYRFRCRPVRFVEVKQS